MTATATGTDSVRRHIAEPGLAPTRSDRISAEAARVATSVPALRFFGAELRRMREAAGLSQRDLAASAMYSRTNIAAVELAERWPAQSFAKECDRVLRGDGFLLRLWPLVDAEREATRLVLGGGGTRMELRLLVLRLASLTGADLSVLAIADEIFPE